MNETKMPTSLDKFKSCLDDGVFYIGHASALVRINQKYFLFDPIWNHKPYGEYWTFFPKQINCDEILEKCFGLFISHIHGDHICDPIVEKFKDDVHIMNGRPNLVDRLKGSSLVVHEPFKWHPIEDGVQCYFVPHAFNSIDSSVFIRSKDFCVYVGSDNFLSKELLLEIEPDVPKINVAMIPYAFIHWYPHLMVNMSPQQKNMELHRLNKQSLEQARDFISVLKPETVVPFGSNLFYATGLDHILNQALAPPEALVENPMTTGSFILADGTRYDQRVSEPFEVVEFPPPDFDYDYQYADMRRVELKLTFCNAKVPGNVLLVNDISIDLDDLRVGYKDVAKGKNATAFRFDEPIFRKWIMGEITFEQAIGTRRFICARVPDVYNAKVFDFMNNHL